MFNTSGKKSMTYDDFYKSYETLILNWSLLLGEKLQISPEAVHSIFQQLDCRSKGTIEKQEYFSHLFSSSPP
ncbi:MAG: hypothetical protein P4M11_12980 [Candidatus Pacebacteria bacterium]|nr:hypothetical protein [Candidatus Paceibacterota bacterium]